MYKSADFTAGVIKNRLWYWIVFSSDLSHNVIWSSVHKKKKKKSETKSLDKRADRVQGRMTLGKLNRHLEEPSQSPELWTGDALDWVEESQTHETSRE